MATQFLGVQVSPSRRFFKADYDANPTPAKLRKRVLANDRVQSSAYDLYAGSHVYDEQRFVVVGNEKTVLVAACFYDSITKLSSDAKGQLRDDMELLIDPFNDEIGFVQFVFQLSGKTPKDSVEPHRDAESGQEVLINTHLPYPDAQSSAFEGVRLLKYQWSDEYVQDYSISALRLRWLFAWFNTDEFFRDGKAAGFNVVRYRPYIDEFGGWSNMTGNGSPDAKSFGKIYRWDAKVESIEDVGAQLSGDVLSIRGRVPRRYAAGVNEQSANVKMELAGPTGEKWAIKPTWKGDEFSAKVKVGSARGRFRLYGNAGDAAVEPRYVAVDLPDARRAKKFQLAITYDSPMCVIANHYTPERLDRDFALVASQGISRVHWIEYGDWYSFWHPRHLPLWRYYDRTIKQCGDYLTAACAAAHRQKMEIFGDLKTFDLSMNCFMVDPPLSAAFRKSTAYEKLDKRYTCAIPEIAAGRGLVFAANPAWQRKPNLPVTRVTFYSDIPIPKVKPGDLKLLVSDDNRKYVPYRGKFVLKQGTISRGHQRWTPGGNVPEKGAAPNWFIEISGVQLRSPHLAICIEGESFEFRHRGFMFVEAIGADGQPCVVTPATSGDPQRGFYFWKGWQGWNNMTEAVIGRRAWQSKAIGMIFDEDDTMPAMLEPAFDGARKIWLGRANTMLTAGVDGVSIRTYCHHNGPYHFLKYAFAQPVRETFKSLYGREPEMRDDDYEKIRNIRGDFYTQFIRDVSMLVRSKGKKLSVEIESGIEVPPKWHCRMQLPLQWRKWVEEGLVDELRAKWMSSQSTFLSEEVMPIARRHGVPVQVISRCLHTGLSHRPQETADRIVGAAVAAGFDAYNWYEQQNLVDTNQEGYPMFKGPVRPYFEQVRRTLSEIGRG